MQRKEIFKELEKDLKPRVEYNYKKTAKGIRIMKRTNESTEKVMLKDLINRFNEFEKKNDQRWDEQNKRWEEQNKRWDEQNKRWEKQEAFNSQVFEFMQRQDEFNKAIVQRLDNVESKINFVSQRLDKVIAKNNLSE